jgi:hypothetical protein
LPRKRGLRVAALPQRFRAGHYYGATEQKATSWASASSKSAGRASFRDDLQPGLLPDGPQCRPHAERNAAGCDAFAAIMTGSHYSYDALSERTGIAFGGTTAAGGGRPPVATTAASFTNAGQIVGLSSHGEHERARAALTRIAGFFAKLRKTAEQLTALERWYRILSQALKKFLRGRKLVPPRQLEPAGAASYG